MIEIILCFVSGLSVGSAICILVVISPRIDRIERILNEHGIDDDRGITTGGT